MDAYTREINAAYRGEGGVALAMVTGKGALSGPVGTKLLIREDGSKGPWETPRWTMPRRMDTRRWTSGGRTSSR